MAVERYKEKIYAGVLGKIIGVYLGRPIEGWSYEKICRTFRCSVQRKKGDSSISINQ